MANETRKKRKTAEPDQYRAKRSKDSGVEPDSTTEVRHSFISLGCSFEIILTIATFNI